MKIITTYQCSYCGKIYSSSLEALECESKGLPPAEFNVGDIVTARAGFGWFDGDSRWIANHKEISELHNGGKWHGKHAKDWNCFDSCCAYQFYYVISHIEYVDHEVRYHLCTKAMTDKSGYRYGWTGKHHYAPVLVKNPPSLDITDIVGGKSKELL